MCRSFNTHMARTKYHNVHWSVLDDIKLLHHLVLLPYIVRGEYRHEFRVRGAICDIFIEWMGNANLPNVGQYGWQAGEKDGV